VFEVVTRTICSLMARGRTCSVFSFWIDFVKFILC